MALDTSRPKQSLKRRRLNDHGSVTPEDRLFASQPLPPAVRCGAANPCSCCDRPVPPKAGCSIVCARCERLTCNVCSRTCTHLPPSQPPTPMLSHSPTPPCTPLPPLPLRLAVTFQSAASAVALNSARMTGSGRRKRREFDGGKSPNDNQHVVEDFAGGSLNDEMIIDGRGCGRKVCRSCSFENLQSETITCYDCYGRSPFR